MKKYKAENIQQLSDTAKKIIADFKNEKHFALYGKMGSGKTSLIKEFCKIKGVTGKVTSPTFSIVNEYTDKNGEKIYHFDFYRIKKPEEIFDFGFEDYIDSGNICFMEWPELIEKYLPENIVKINIETDENEIRYFTCRKS